MLVYRIFPFNISIHNSHFPECWQEMANCEKIPFTNKYSIMDKKS